MAKTNNGLSSLITQLSSMKVDGLTISKLLRSASLASAAQTSTSSSALAKPPFIGDTKALSFATKDAPTGINFGSPSNSRISATQSSNEFTNLLKQTASGGLASALTGSLGSIAGLGGLISGIASIFGVGNKSTPPPLVEFQLPDSQQQTVYVSSKSSATYQGTDIEQANAPVQGTGLYTNTNSQTLQYQSSQIAQAVKGALLNSSTLNDVIAEI